MLESCIVAPSGKKEVLVDQCVVWVSVAAFTLIITALRIVLKRFGKSGNKGKANKVVEIEGSIRIKFTRK